MFSFHHYRKPPIIFSHLKVDVFCRQKTFVYHILKRRFICLCFQLLSSSKMTIHVQNIPSELLLETFQFLDLNENERNELVSRRWHQLIQPHKKGCLSQTLKIRKLVINYNPVSSWSQTIFAHSR